MPAVIFARGRNSPMIPVESTSTPPEGGSGPEYQKM
jgi:hypothetical protein